MEIKINNLKKSFGEKVAVDIENYIVNKGDIVGLVGNNGAGKTTLFRLLLDLIKPDNGEALIQDLKTSETEDWKNITGAFIDEGFLIDFLTPDEYFDFICKVNGISQEECQQRLNMYEHIMNGEIRGVNKLIRNLSAGNKQKVGIIGAMLHNPQILILDEPFNFLDPSSQHAMKNILKEYCNNTGATVIVSSHNLTHTFELCNRITLLELGKIIMDGYKNDENLVAQIEEYFIDKS